MSIQLGHSSIWGLKPKKVTKDRQSASSYQRMELLPGPVASCSATRGTWTATGGDETAPGSRASCSTHRGKQEGTSSTKKHDVGSMAGQEDSRKRKASVTIWQEKAAKRKSGSMDANSSGQTVRMGEPSNVTISSSAKDPTAPRARKEKKC